MIQLLLIAAVAALAFFAVSGTGATASESTPSVPDPGTDPSASWDPLAPPPNPAASPDYTAPDMVVIPGDPHDWDNQIVYACNAAGIQDPAAYQRLKAIIAHESSFVPNKVGDANPSAPQYRGYGPGTCVDQFNRSVGSAGYCSLGLGQVNRCVHDDGGNDLLDGNQNILVAAQIFAGALQSAGGDLDRATEIYNGTGPTTLVYLAQVKAIETGWTLGL